MSQTAPGFSWCGAAIKHLCGQGDLYIRLKRDMTTQLDKRNVAIDDDKDLMEISYTPAPTRSTTSDFSNDFTSQSCDGNNSGTNTSFVSSRRFDVGTSSSFGISSTARRSDDGTTGNSSTSHTLDSRSNGHTSSSSSYTMRSRSDDDCITGSSSTSYTSGGRSDGTSSYTMRSRSYDDGTTGSSSISHTSESRSNDHTSSSFRYTMGSRSDDNGTTGSSSTSYTSGSTSDDGTSSIYSYTARSRLDGSSSNPFMSVHSSSVTDENLYEMFPDFSRKSIDVVHSLTSMNIELTVNTLLDIGPDKILSLFNKQRVDGPPIKLKVDEEDIFNDALLFYKETRFDPTRPLRVSFLHQPAVDTGGVRRQFFTDVLDKFAFDDPYSMFVGEKLCLRPANSPQLLPLFKLLGTIIVHSLVQEGPGFPFLAPYVFRYLATDSEELALSYVTSDDLSQNVSIIIEKVRSFKN